jgi:O-methyltransferase
MTSERLPEHPNFADWFDAMLSHQDEDGRRRAINKRDRLSALFSLASSVKHVPGCTAECGVFKGASSYLIVAATRTSYSLHYCFDSFMGLSTPQKEDFVPEKDDSHWMVDFFEPTRDSIAFFYPRMASGGIILFDEYDSPSCPGARKAIDSFLADKRQKIVPLTPLSSAYLKFE